jgi:hypothetical protein
VKGRVFSWEFMDSEVQELKRERVEEFTTEIAVHGRMHSTDNQGKRRGERPESVQKTDFAEHEGA